MPSALVRRINIRYGAPRAGDLLPRRVTDTKTSRQSPKKEEGGNTHVGDECLADKRGGILSGGGGGGVVTSD